MNNARSKEDLIIDVIKNLKLSKWGEERLRCFTEDAIFESCYIEYGNFNELITHCIDYSRKNNLPIDWKNYYEIPKQMAKGDSWVTTTNPRNSPSSSPQTNQTWGKQEFPKRGNRHNLTSEERLIHSQDKYQTVMRPFYGLSDTLTQDDPSISATVKFDSLPEYTKELGNSNPYPNTDSNYSSDYCMNELNFFANLINQHIVSDPYHKTFGFGNTLAYLGRVLKNWEQQYFFALEREKR